MRNAPADKIIDACKKACLHDFIMSLPNEYGTENGARLSGGQRQRIFIARTFLKDAPILSLDEMTSNVDPINESRIQNAVTELAERRPAIVIAHRLKTVQNADPILVFQRNALVESGTRRALLERGGYYKSLREKAAAARICCPHAVRQGLGKIM